MEISPQRGARGVVSRAGVWTAGSLLPLIGGRVADFQFLIARRGPDVSPFSPEAENKLMPALQGYILPPG